MGWQTSELPASEVGVAIRVQFSVVPARRIFRAQVSLIDSIGKRLRIMAGLITAKPTEMYDKMCGFACRGISNSENFPLRAKAALFQRGSNSQNRNESPKAWSPLYVIRRLLNNPNSVTKFTDN
jgi:hypothetical protein